MTIITNAIKVEMKKGQYKILDDFFKSGKSEKVDEKYIIHAKKLYRLYKALPEDIEYFEGLAKLDEMNYGTTIIRLNAEEKTLEEVAGAYRHSYSQNPDLPTLKEMVDLYNSLEQKYSKKY